MEKIVFLRNKFTHSKHPHVVRYKARIPCTSPPSFNFYVEQSLGYKQSTTHLTQEDKSGLFEQTAGKKMKVVVFMTMAQRPIDRPAGPTIFIGFPKDENHKEKSLDHLRNMRCRKGRDQQTHKLN